MRDRESADPDYVQSFVRGLDVIRAFSRFRPRMTLSEVAEETQMTRAAARRFLLTLVKENYAQTDGKYFELRPKVLDLGFAYLASMTLWDIAEPIMRSVVEKTQESCSMAVLDDLEIVYVARVPTNRVMTIGLSVGSRLPAYCTSMGRVLLAALPEEALAKQLSKITPEKLTPQTITSKVKLRDELRDVARQGWSLVDQELEAGLRSLAVPIRSRSGAVAAAMNLGCHAGRVSIETMTDKFLPILQEASVRITSSLPA
ncbi:IclR family transcriptional regulator domain-containing protein [Taklimakanibacter deserti]|uniref:IclR family transcriptional regulator domain-containing protein n=1 Tax=Taklimakanibacter deserti TaxID=2267839 RepID=UPI000E64E127